MDHLHRTILVGLTSVRPKGASEWKIESKCFLRTPRLVVWNRDSLKR